MKQTIGRIKVIVTYKMLIFIKIKAIWSYHNIVVVFVKVTSLLKSWKAW